ncbi:MAG: amino acid ABC transporter permease, partial [Clostridia bacterium]
MSFFEWVWRILKENYTFLLQGIGFTMLMALVGTFIGFAIGLGVAIVRTIPTEENSSKIKKILLGAIKAIF